MRAAMEYAAQALGYLIIAFAASYGGVRLARSRSRDRR